MTSGEHKLRDIHSVESAKLLECELEHLDFLDLKIAKLDDDISERMRPHDSIIEQIDTVHGIGRRGAEECPKAVKIESLDKMIQDGEGNQIELYQMIADDNAVDVSDRLDARLILQSYPHKFVKIAYKKYAGYPLPISERTYLYRQRSKAYKCSQKSLVLV